MQELVIKLIQPEKNIDINTYSGIKNLIKLINQRGFTICNVKAKGYFYTSIANDDIEVVADSRANLRPRNRIEGVIVACIKIYINEEKDWQSLSEHLGLNYQLLLNKSKQNGIN